MAVYLSSLEGCEGLGKHSRSLDPSGQRGVRVLDPRERRARAVRNDQFLWDLQAARLCAQFNLSARAYGFGDDIAAGETEANQSSDRRVLVVPAALGAAGRKRVARHVVAVLKCAFGLIMQRRAKVCDRIDEVQPFCEEPQIGLLRRGGGWHCELGEIEQRSRVRRADRSCRAEPTPRSSLQAR